jgi:protein-tyrosine phosphatase
MNPAHWLFDKLYPVIRFVYERIQRHPWFDEISPELWMGGAPTYSRDYDFLVDNDITAVVNIRAERDDNQDFYKEHGIKYLRIPVLDVLVPTPDDLDRGVAFIDERIKEGDVVLVHCAKGRGRSATLTAAYLMRHEGMTYEQARDFLVSKRSLTNLQSRHQKVLEAWLDGADE